MTINKVKQLIIIILVIYLGFLSSDIFWKYYTPEEQIIPNEIINITTNSQTLSNGLFGVEQQITQQTAPTYEQVRPTKLDVTLIGIMNKEKTPLAIIRFADNRVEIYGVDDSIRGIATLKAIENNFVIINYNNEDEKLIIQRQIDNSILNSPENNSTTSTASSPAKTTPPAQVSTNDITIPSGAKQSLKRYLQQASINPITLLEVIDVEPYFVDGNLAGIRVFPGKESALFNSIGLKSGDIITKVNETILNNLPEAFQLIQNISSQTEFNVSIMRNNQLQDIYFSLN